MPWSIVPATQLHDFAEMLTTWTERDGSARIAPLLVQSVAHADVADVLAEVAVGQPQGRYPDVGHEPPEERPHRRDLGVGVIDEVDAQVAWTAGASECVQRRPPLTAALARPGARQWSRPMCTACGLIAPPQYAASRCSASVNARARLATSASQGAPSSRGSIRRCRRPWCRTVSPICSFPHQNSAS